MRRTEAHKALAVLSAAYPRQPLSPETAAVWGESLASVDAELADATAAIIWLAENQTFFPALAEVLEAVRERAAMRRRAGRLALPPPQPLSPEERAANLVIGAEVIREWRLAHPAAEPPEPEPLPPEPRLNEADLASG